MVKVLITGAKGQLGRCLKNESKLYQNVKFVFTDQEELDITNEVLVVQYFNKHQFDYCINCAAYTAVDQAESHKEEAYKINAEAVKILSEACLKTDCTLIHISTDFVFDGSQNTPYTEEDLPNPLNVYGASKYKGELYIQKLLSKFFVIRTSWVYSQYGNNFVKTMLRLGNEKKELNVVDDQIGSPTNARDLAIVIMKIIKTRSKKYGLYHFSNEGETSWFNFANIIFQQYNIDTKINPISSASYPSPVKRAAYSVLDKSKINKILKINIDSWEKSLKNTNYEN